MVIRPLRGHVISRLPWSRITITPNNYNPLPTPEGSNNHNINVYIPQNKNSSTTFTIMSTYTQILYQIVFSTKRRARVLTKERREDLFKYIGAVIRNNKSVHYQIGGVEDHIHIIIDLHPSIALASLIKDIKLSSSNYIKSQKLFPRFEGWQNGYGAFSYAIGAKNNLINYVKNQEVHHASVNFEDEYRKLLAIHEIKIEERFFLRD